MSLSNRPYRGTRDFFPPLKREQDYIFQKWTEVAKRFGHEPYDGPLLEEVDLYRAKSGEEIINDQIYSFYDRGERFVAIRPEMTPTLARMISQVHQEISKPIRWFSIPNVYRYEKPQRGRLREHWQLNVDIFGAPGITGEIEILQFIVYLFESFGAKSADFKIHLNDRKIVDGILKSCMKLTEEQALRVYKIIDRFKKETPEKIESLLSEIGLSFEQKAILNQYINCHSFEMIQSFLTELKLESLSDRFRHLTNAIQESGIAPYCEYDPAIVRGLDYYTGVVFEAFDLHPENRRALCGGGAYENLLKIFNGPTLPAVGMGLGDVTMTDFLKIHGLMPDFSTPSIDILAFSLDENSDTKLLKISQDIRKLGLSVTTQFGAIKLKKGFDLSEKRGANFILFFSDEEYQNKKINLRNLKTREQREFNIDHLDEITNWIQAK